MDFPLAARRGKRNDGLLRLSQHHPDIGRADMNSDRSPQRLTQASPKPWERPGGIVTESALPLRKA